MFVPEEETNLEFDADLFQGAPPRYSSEPFTTNLDEHLQNKSFIDYGSLSEYELHHEQGMDSFAYKAVQLLKKIQGKSTFLNAFEQASLIIRYVAYKGGGLNYLEDNYSIPPITYELALAGYREGSKKAEAWEKLLRAERLQQERHTTRRRIQRIPLDIPETPQPIPTHLPSLPPLHP